MVTHNEHNDKVPEIIDAIACTVPGFKKHFPQITGQLNNGVFVLDFPSDYQRNMVESRLAHQVQDAAHLVAGVARVKFTCSAPDPQPATSDQGDDAFAAIYDSLVDQNGVVAYRLEFRRITGNTSAALLLQQLVFWWTRMGRKPFYKFVRPAPNNRAYTAGDSLAEELGFGRYELESAIKKVQPFASYSRDGRKLTWWSIHENEIVEKLG